MAGAADAAEDLRRLIDELDPVALGAQLEKTVRELYPILRSITGEGLRASLRVLQRLAPIELIEVPSGTEVLDWVVPREWNVSSARLFSPDGEVIADAAQLNLHLLNYSVPFHGTVGLEELESHLHSLPDAPALVPYRTSYYREAWGFCLSHAQRTRLCPGQYRVEIDTRLTEGSLTYGEAVVRGAVPEEILISTHCCHPSLANDNCAGMAMCALLAQQLGRMSPRYTYRFLFVPGTIGAIAWLSQNAERARRIRHGMVLACLGDPGPFTWKRSRQGDHAIDRAVEFTLARSGRKWEARPFTPYGYDERQYGSPGFDLPVGRLTRTPNAEYPEYHTSADDLSLIRPEALVDSLDMLLRILEVVEGDRVYVNTQPMCEPQLGRRGLYHALGGRPDPGTRTLAMLWVLNQSDGKHSLRDIALRAELPFDLVRETAELLLAHELLRPA